MLEPKKGYRTYHRKVCNSSKHIIHAVCDKKGGEDIPMIDRIIRVCCVLTNVCDSGYYGKNISLNAYVCDSVLIGYSLNNYYKT